MGTMNTFDTGIQFLLDLSKTQAIVNRRLDSGLGGLGLNEFIILYHLHRAENEKMRRIDLAEKIGLTASGVTRILLPMEKVGYIKKQANKDDARVSLVSLAPGGKRRLEEASDRMKYFLEEISSFQQTRKLKEASQFLSELGATLR